MAKPSPFAGVKLSEQTPVQASSLEQRLFSSPAPKLPPQPESVKEAPSKTRKLENKEARKLGNQEARKEASSSTPPEPTPLFDINQLAYKKVAFVFTGEEFDALEDMKIQIRRRFDIRAIKNDLVRCAIHLLIEDYQRNGKASLAVRRLSGKRVR